jgi:uncharacterized protein DUF4430
VFRRSSVALVAIAAALTLAPAGLSALVHVRVEGKTVTLFGPANPVVSATTPMEALESASLAGEFYYHVTTASFGPYVDQIGRYPAAGTTGWVFKVNGVSPPVGADKVELKDGDTVLWYYADFATGSGPPTLVLTKTAASCYRATGQDDQGQSKVPPGTAFHVGARTIAAPAGRVCLKRPHVGLVYATAPGAVRSNRLP